jgi:hypothetical protein
MTTDRRMRQPADMPSEYLERNTHYKFEVLAIDAGGNQTLMERSFVVR